MHIVPIGGRIKAASVGLDLLYPTDGENLDDRIRRARKDPSEELRLAFFPKTGKELRHMLDGIGLYRPMLKTDQGMPGNFFPFWIAPSLTMTDLSRRSVSYQEGALLAEEWGGLRNGALQELRTAFQGLDLAKVFPHLERMEGRQADKGRAPVFLVRPALVDRPIVLGQDIMTAVQAAVTTQLHICIEAARDAELQETGNIRDPNLIYVQPDVFIDTSGNPVVEAIRCPDVGLFLTQLKEESAGSVILPHIVKIMEQLREAVCGAILDQMGRNIVIVTRDAVLARGEDMLEHREIESLTEILTESGADVRTISVRDVASLPRGTSLLLLNLDHRTESCRALRALHASGAITCYPNPFVQMACQELTGLTAQTVPDMHREQFLSLARSIPSTPQGLGDVLKRLDERLQKGGLHGDTLYVQLEKEMVPVFRRSMHSWRQLASRASRPENSNGPIRIQSVPARPSRLLITSGTGPRMHVFRFMAVV